MEDDRFDAIAKTLGGQKRCCLREGHPCDPGTDVCCNGLFCVEDVDHHDHKCRSKLPIGIGT